MHAPAPRDYAYAARTGQFRPSEHICVTDGDELETRLGDSRWKHVIEKAAK